MANKRTGHLYILFCMDKEMKMIMLRVNLRNALILAAAVFCFQFCNKKIDGAVMSEKGKMEIVNNLERHVEFLTKKIGERSVAIPGNLEKTALYIESIYKKNGIKTVRESYDFEGIRVNNIVAGLNLEKNISGYYLIGAHYDSVTGTVGADDNASAVAVQLETARILAEELKKGGFTIGIKFVSFALEEPPAYNSGYMGSRVHAKKARAAGENILGMICLEMVGYTCMKQGCQDYPLPLKLMNYPKTGDFIAIVGDSDSEDFTESLYRAFKKNRGLPVIRLVVPLKGRFLPDIRLSDHSSFWDEGFKAVMVTDTAFYRNPNYHMATDVMETLDFNFMSGVVESLILFFNDLK